MDGYLMVFLPAHPPSSVLAQQLKNIQKNYGYFTKIGQFPIFDGLFGWLRLAYFSGLQIELTSVSPKWSSCCP
jgi:hypothetical protein